MSTLDGSVISMCDDRHGHQEWLKFLRVIDDLTPPCKELHLIAENYPTHKHPKVQKWLLVERFFRDLTEQRFRHLARRPWNLLAFSGW